MTIKVLVVDDSRFFRRRVSEILQTDGQIEVVDTAENGAEAISKTLALRPNVITMDIEMPVLDGISAVRKIMALYPTPILMFSSLTTEGAQATLDALEAGALDYLPKKFEDISSDASQARWELVSRVKALAIKGVGVRQASMPVKVAAPGARPVAVKKPSSKPDLVVIGCSTGGPVAVHEVLKKLPANFSLPILIVQHMPAAFTPTFADRMDRQCKINVREARDGDMIKPGVVLIAPGGKQMLLKRKNMVSVIEGDQTLNYKPCVDLTLNSVAEFYSSSTLVIIMTGMGADGREGARKLKKSGSRIWAQDERSCVVFGMPGAIVSAGLSDKVLPLTEIGHELAELV